jgi:hypothetical protein
MEIEILRAAIKHYKATLHELHEQRRRIRADSKHSIVQSIRSYENELMLLKHRLYKL